MIKSTSYCDILKEASFESKNKDFKMCIEEIYIHAEKRKELRFAYYKINDNNNYKLVVRPLDVTEDELYILFLNAIEEDIINDSLSLHMKNIIDNTEVGSCKSEAFNDTEYCRFYARGSFEVNNVRCSIEQIFIKDLDRREVRFAYYKKNKNDNYQLVPRPLDVTEDEFLEMFRQAIKNGVFSKIFLKALYEALK